MASYVTEYIWVKTGLDESSFPDGTVAKNRPASAGGARNVGSILGRSPGVGNGNSFQYSCLENSVDRGAWWATARSHQEPDTAERREQKELRKSTWGHQCKRHRKRGAALPFSRGSSWPRSWAQVSHTGGRFFTIWATREVPTLPTAQ